MRRRLALVALLAWAWLAPPAAAGTLELRTRPPGATVQLNGHYWGRTPWRRDLPGGWYAVTLNGPGNRARAYRLYVRDAGVTRRTIALGDRRTLIVVPGDEQAAKRRGPRGAWRATPRWGPKAKPRRTWEAGPRQTWDAGSRRVGGARPHRTWEARPRHAWRQAPRAPELPPWRPAAMQRATEAPPPAATALSTIPAQLPNVVLAPPGPAGPPWLAMLLAALLVPLGIGLSDLWRRRREAVERLPGMHLEGDVLVAMAMRLECWETAGLLLERLVVAGTATADQYYHLGLVRARQERWLEAEGAWRTAALLAPDDPDAALALAIALEQVGEHGQAVLAYRGVLARFPRNAAARARLARLCARLTWRPAGRPPRVAGSRRDPWRGSPSGA